MRHASIFASALLLATPFVVACEENPRAESPSNPSDDDDVEDADVTANDPDAYADTDPSAVTDFRPTLDPYGTWVEDDDYGMVWIPRSDVVGADFTPYVSAGHWVYGEGGAGGAQADWVWVSDYEWGWAPFHYGRWVWIEGRGWAWIPGRVYRGAWVVWAVGEPGYAYIGWSPWPPLWIWRGGYAVRLGVRVYPRYVYCAHGDVFAPVVAGHVVARGPAVAVAAHMRPFAAASVGVRGSVGPAPSHLGLDVARVPHPAPGDRGLARAQSFSRAPSARAMGGRAPTGPAHHFSGGGSHGSSHAPSHAAPRGGGGGHGGGGHHR